MLNEYSLHGWMDNGWADGPSAKFFALKEKSFFHLKNNKAEVCSCPALPVAHSSADCSPSLLVRPPLFPPAPTCLRQGPVCPGCSSSHLPAPALWLDGHLPLRTHPLWLIVSKSIYFIVARGGEVRGRRRSPGCPWRRSGGQCLVPLCCWPDRKSLGWACWRRPFQS